MRAVFALDANRESALSNREARRAYSSVPRVASLRYQAWVNAAAARRLVGGLRANTALAILMPFWPAADVWANAPTAALTGGWMLVWKADWSQYAIYPRGGAAPGWPLPGDLWAPLLTGFFPQAVEARWLNDDLARIEVEFAESGPVTAALAFAPQTWSAGPLPGPAWTVAPDLAPFPPDWSEPVADTFSLKVERTRTAFTHAQATTFYPQSVTRVNTAEYQLAGAPTIARFLRWWQDHAASAAVWTPGWASAARLIADLGPGTSTLPVDDSSALQPGDWLAVIDAGGTLHPTQATSVGAGTVGITPSLGPLAAAGSTVTSLLLSRFATAECELEWTTTALAAAKLALREVPPEYIPDAAETLGTTLGALPLRAVLFELTDPSGTVYRYTSHEQAVSYGGHTYTAGDAGQWAHGDIRESLNLEQNSVELSSFVYSGNPLLPLLNLTTEGFVNLVIRWANVALSGGVMTAGTTTAVFTGQITKVSIEGNRIKATATPLGLRFDESLPRFTRAPMCFATLFCDGCNLVQSDWKYTATVATPISNAYPYSFHIAGLSAAGGGPSGAGASLFTNWFAGGWIEYTPPGGGPTQRRNILASTAPSGGAATLTLDRPLSVTPSNGDAVVVYPGCDQQYTTCQKYNSTTNPTGKFNNYLNFRGAPFTPPGNPALVKRTTPNAGGKK